MKAMGSHIRQSAKAVSSYAMSTQRDAIVPNTAICRVGNGVSLPMAEVPRYRAIV
jgi:hypothetical protein